MYDIKTTALNLEVTVQTVYNHLKRNKQELKNHIFKSKGTTYIDDAGLIILKKSMGLIQVPTVEKEELTIDDMIESISTSIKNDLLKDLNSVMLEREQRMQTQYEEKLELFKQEIIERHQEQISTQNAKLIDYIALTREQDRETKKGFISRLFNR